MINRNKKFACYYEKSYTDTASTMTLQSVTKLSSLLRPFLEWLLRCFLSLLARPEAASFLN